MALVKSMFLCILVVSAILAADTESLIYVGYGTLYNASVAENGKLSGHLWRIACVQHWKRLMASIDAQNRISGGRQNPFLQTTAGYLVLEESWFPNVWVEGGIIYMDALAQPSQGQTIETLEGGVGINLDFRTDWLPQGYSNFSVMYYPATGFFYKNMQVGWDIVPHLGVSFGGLGIRIREGRLYSSFIFAVRGQF